MASADGGLAAAAYAPSEVRTKIDGKDVTVTETTDYPFRDRISLLITTSAAAAIPLAPAHSRNGPKIRAISINGQKVDGVATQVAYKRIDREWRKGDRVEIVFPMPVRAIQGFNGSISVERGPLVYALANRRALEQAEADRSRNRLGGLSDFALELRAPRGSLQPRHVLHGTGAACSSTAFRQRSAGDIESRSAPVAAMGHRRR